MIAATAPVQRPADARLLVIDSSGGLSHVPRRAFPRFVTEGDVIVANDAATLPASLAGTHLPSGAPVEVRLAGRRSLASTRVTRFTALLFGEGDYRTPTEERPLPTRVREGDLLQLGPLRAVVVESLLPSRLIELEFLHPPADVWEGLARHGRPIQYAHVPEPLHIWDTWTRIAATPAAFEPPSAGFLLDWRMLGELRGRGAEFVTLTHAAGISSTGDVDLDRLLPFDEPYAVPSSTAAAINRALQERRRIIAVGTSVVRALEHACRSGQVRAGHGIATGRIGSRHRLAIVDAIISGTHEPGTSHYDLLGAFQPAHVLARATAEADARGYRTHEFGDSIFVMRRDLQRGTRSAELMRKAELGLRK